MGGSGNAISFVAMRALIRLIGGVGNDYIRGGEGIDTVVYDHTESVCVDPEEPSEAEHG